MRKISVLLGFLILACSSSTRTGFSDPVADHEGILTHEQVEILSQLLIEHERRTTNEIVLVTTPDMDGHEHMIDFAVDHGNKHGVGRQGRTTE